MNPKDIIETVPLSAIRKVIELDAQDAREIKTAAIQMLAALEAILPTIQYALEDKLCSVKAREIVQAAIKKGKEVL